MLSFSTLSLLFVAALPSSSAGSPAAVPDSAGCRIEPVAVAPDRAQFQFSGLAPDQRRLVVAWKSSSNDAERGAYILDLVTGATTDLPAFINNAGSFSPNGQRIISASDTAANRTEILEYRLADATVSTIAPHPGWDFLPTYFADGRRVIFNSYRTGESDLYVTDLETGALERLTANPRYEAHAQISPDQETVAFVRRMGDTDYDIVLLDLQTGAERSFQRSPREESYPAWSPDGRHLVFSSDRDSEVGKNDLYLARVDGGEVHRLTRHPEDDSYSTWTADGRSIIFVSKRDGHGVYRLWLGEHSTRETGC